MAHPFEDGSQVCDLRRSLNDSTAQGEIAVLCPRRRPILPLVQLDIGIFPISAVKDNYYDIPSLLADQCDEFIQITLLVFGQKCNIALHIHKI